MFANVASVADSQHSQDDPPPGSQKFKICSRRKRVLPRQCGFSNCQNQWHEKVHFAVTRAFCLHPPDIYAGFCVDVIVPKSSFTYMHIHICIHSKSQNFGKMEVRKSENLDFSIFDMIYPECNRSALPTRRARPVPFSTDLQQQKWKCAAGSSTKCNEFDAFFNEGNSSALFSQNMECARTRDQLCSMQLQTIFFFLFS